MPASNSDHFYQDSTIFKIFSLNLESGYPDLFLKIYILRLKVEEKYIIN